MKVKIQNFRKVQRAIAQKAAERLENPRQIKGHSVIVGYTAGYALYVHEAPMTWKGIPRDPRLRPGVKHQKNPRPRQFAPKGFFWDPHGKAQNKFLEQPARELTNDGTLGGIVIGALRRMAKLQQALYLAGLRIQRESQKLVPVDTGNLKNSAFTRKE